MAECTYPPGTLEQGTCLLREATAGLEMDGPMRGADDRPPFAIQGGVTPFRHNAEARGGRDRASACSTDLRTAIAKLAREA